MRREQATVRDWDAQTGGSALRDDGSVVLLPVDALQGSSFRLLRSGQRVNLLLDGEQVRQVDLP
jgi:hypothetical protein